MTDARVRKSDVATARDLIVEWQRIKHPNHTGPSLFDCERRQLENLYRERIGSLTEEELPMILIPAKATCDEPHCKETCDITLRVDDDPERLRHDSHDESDHEFEKHRIAVHDHPDGWEVSVCRCRCFEHRRRY